MKSLKTLAVSTLAIAAGASQAAAVDVTAVVTDIGAQLVPIGLVASAVLLLHLAIKAFKWVRQAMA